jgi:hypothetical protein
MSDEIKMLQLDAALKGGLIDYREYCRRLRSGEWLSLYERTILRLSRKRWPIGGRAAEKEKP